MKQSCGNDEELAGARQVGKDLHMGEELVRDLRKRDLGDVEAFARDELEEQIERPLENIEDDREVIDDSLVGRIGIRLRRHGR